MILSAAYVLRFIQKVIFGKPARDYTEGKRVAGLEGFTYGVMLALLLVFGFHPSFITDSLRIYDEPAVEQTGSDAAPVEEESVEIEEFAEEDPDNVEPLESHIVTSADIAKLDSSLIGAGFSEEERKELIKQVIETEANIAKATAYAIEKQQREEDVSSVRDLGDKDYELNDSEMNEKEANND